jgi:hypothetical protein
MKTVTPLDVHMNKLMRVVGFSRTTASTTYDHYHPDASVENTTLHRAMLTVRRLSIDSMAVQYATRNGKDAYYDTSSEFRMTCDFLRHRTWARTIVFITFLQSRSHISTKENPNATIVDFLCCVLSNNSPNVDFVIGLNASRG